MDKAQIVKTLIFYSRFFPFIKGDVVSRQEIAEKIAEEMENYPGHDLWKDVDLLSKSLPGKPKKNLKESIHKMAKRLKSEKETNLTIF